ncbi:Zn-dependent hydrolase [Gracilaria domingensis]|nr:Zn-dependent hydrolase [Gracilaria domingensis]
MKAAGLHVSHDAVGNMFGTWEGTTSLPGVLTGSHIDAIPHSGMYDGTLGAIGAIEAVRALRQSGFSPQRSITIVMFTSEEPTRFGLSCIGSRLLVNAMKIDELDDLQDDTQTSFHSARKHAGYDQDMDSVSLDASSFSAFVELHIEQADVLEKSGVSIGAVSHIAAPASAEVMFEGDGGHAGSLLMKYRNDAGLAAAQLALAVEKAALRRGEDCVATTGKLELFPGAVNSVPSKATLSIDVRDVDLERRDSALQEIETEMKSIAVQRDVSAELEVHSKDDPAVCDSRIVDTVVNVAEQLGLSVTRMVSRAYHDALFMAKLFPTAMIFVPCRDGVSHRPDEFVKEGDVYNGVAVLAGVLRKLAGEEKTEL